MRLVAGPNLLQLAALAALVAAAGLAQANSDANRLYEDLMMSYNRFVRPVQNHSDLLVVKLGLKLSQLIDVVSLAQPPNQHTN